jgi:hypothetical protein
MAKLTIFALALSVLLVSSNAVGLRKLQQVRICARCHKLLLVIDTAPGAGSYHLRHSKPCSACKKHYHSSRISRCLLFWCFQDGLFNCGGVQKLGESAANNKCCELCWCMVSDGENLEYIAPSSEWSLSASVVVVLYQQVVIISVLSCPGNGRPLYC